MTKNGETVDDKKCDHDNPVLAHPKHTERGVQPDIYRCPKCGEKWQEPCLCLSKDGEGNIAHWSRGQVHA